MAKNALWWYQLPLIYLCGYRYISAMTNARQGSQPAPPRLPLEPPMRRAAILPKQICGFPTEILPGYNIWATVAHELLFDRRALPIESHIFRYECSEQTTERAKR